MVSQDKTENKKQYIRKAEDKDAVLLSQIGFQTFREAYAEHPVGFKAIKKYAHNRFVLDPILSELHNQKNTFFLFCITDDEGNEKIIGYSLIHIEKKICSLKRLYFYQGYCGLGYGETLLKQCIDYAKSKKSKKMTLGVWEKNHGAIKFYEKHGFIKNGTQSFPLEGTDVIDTDVLMEHAL